MFKSLFHEKQLIGPQKYTFAGSKSSQNASIFHEKNDGGVKFFIGYSYTAGYGGIQEYWCLYFLVTYFLTMFTYNFILLILIDTNLTSLLYNNTLHVYLVLTLCVLGSGIIVTFCALYTLTSFSKMIMRSYYKVNGT